MPQYKKIRTTKSTRRQPRILICTPEITELPEGMGNAANYIQAKGGGLGDISAGLIRYLHKDKRFSLHVVIPKYDQKIRGQTKISSKELDVLAPLLDRKGIHLVRDSAFSNLKDVYDESENHPRIRRAEAFQRYIINQLLDDIRPDVVHCNDWMTSLVPAAAKERGIKSIFTLHNVFTEFETPQNLDRSGIDAERFLKHLYFERFPGDKRDTWLKNRVDFTASGVFAADIVNTVSPSFLREIVEGEFEELIPESIRLSVIEKFEKGQAHGILNAPNDTVDPRLGRFITHYDESDVVEGKAANKLKFQEAMGLAPSPDKPLFLWPSRLYTQKGTDIFMPLLPELVDKFDMQIAFVANGERKIQNKLARLARARPGAIARKSFSEELSEIGKAGADFVLMPSLYEPCGLPQMEGPRFGTLPIARLTGGLRDTVSELRSSKNEGNGFVFADFKSDALSKAIGRAVKFYAQKPAVKKRNIQRIMTESFEDHSLANTAQAYIKLYESLIDG